MRLILNEKEVLDSALNEGRIENKPSVTIEVLAKHYFGIGQNKEQVLSSIDSFMSNNYSGYVFTKWQRSIKRIINSIYRKNDFELIHVDMTNVYEKEINEIRAIKNLNLEKLAFSLLVYAKIFNQINKNKNNWVNADLKEVLNDARINTTRVEGALMVKELYNMDLVRPSKIVDNTNIKVLFADLHGDVAIEVCDFRDIVYYYLKYIGDVIGNCEVCGRLIRLTSNRQRYCRECWREHRNKYQKNLMKNIRNRSC